MTRANQEVYDENVCEWGPPMTAATYSDRTTPAPRSAGRRNGAILKRSQHRTWPAIVLGAFIALLAPISLAPQAVALTSTVTSFTSISPSTASYGSTAQILKGRLTKSSGTALGGRQVAIQAYDPVAKKWVTVGSATTSTKGYWSWTRPVADASVTFRARYGGSSTYAADSSPSRTANVKAAASWTSKPPSTTYSAIGAQVTAAGIVAPAAAKVSLQRYYSSAWHTVQSQTVTDGAFSFAIPMTSTSTLKWRVKADPVDPLVGNYYYDGFLTKASKPTTWTVSTTAFGPFLKLGYTSTTGQVAGTVGPVNPDFNASCDPAQYYKWDFTQPLLDPLDVLVDDTSYYGFDAEWRQRGSLDNLDGFAFYNPAIKTTKGIHADSTLTALKAAYGSSLEKLEGDEVGYVYYGVRDSTTKSGLLFSIEVATNQVDHFQLVYVDRDAEGNYLYKSVWPGQCGEAPTPPATSGTERVPADVEEPTDAPSSIATKD